MKQYITTIIIFILIVGMMAIIFIGSNGHKAATENISSEKKTKEQTDQPNTNIYFWGTTCPYCHEVLEWMDENNIEDKVPIIKKEVYNNQNNSSELLEAARHCGMDTTSIGVPFLVTIDQQCLVGAPNIKEYLINQAKQLSEQPDTSMVEKGHDD